MSGVRKYVLGVGLVEQLKTTIYWEFLDKYLKAHGTLSAKAQGWGTLEIKSFSQEHAARAQKFNDPTGSGFKSSYYTDTLGQLWQRLLEDSQTPDFARPWEVHDGVPQVYPATALDRVLLSGYVASRAVPMEELVKFHEMHFKTFSACAGTLGAVLLTGIETCENSIEQFSVRDPERNEVRYRPLF